MKKRVIERSHPESLGSLTSISIALSFYQVEREEANSVQEGHSGLHHVWDLIVWRGSDKNHLPSLCRARVIFFAKSGETMTTEYDPPQLPDVSTIPYVRLVTFGHRMKHDGSGFRRAD